MRNGKRPIPWWIYLALAVLVFMLCGLGYELATQWLGSVSSTELTFAHTFLVNFLGVLRFALPLFFVVLGVFALSRPTPPKVGNAVPLPGKHPPSSAPPAPPATGSRTRSEIPSEAMGVNYGLLRCMEWRRFEIVCAEYLRCMNFEVLETGYGDKDAVDLEVFLPGKSEILNVVRCVSQSQPVDVPVLREFLDVMKRRQVVEGMVFAVCGFTNRAERFASRHRIALVSGEVLCGQIRSLERESISALVEVATSGDYTTPTCPVCGVKMVLRRQVRSRPGQREFWGCMNHPRCERTLPFESE
jgi:restriction system protein